jgi:hypothetical protein
MLYNTGKEFAVSGGLLLEFGKSVGHGRRPSSWWGRTYTTIAPKKFFLVNNKYNTTIPRVPDILRSEHFKR